MALLLDRATIENLLDMKEAIDLMEQAFVELGNGAVDMPQRLTITDADRAGWTAVMPANLKDTGALGVKTVTVFRNNPAKHGTPSTLATLLLLDRETGQPLSVMDGGYITAMRTGAVSGLATRYLAREDATIAGVIGTGEQARTQLLAMCTERPIEQAVCFSTSSYERQHAFAREMGERIGIPIETVNTARDVVEVAEVLALATTSREPVIKGEWFKPGMHINGIGAHMQQTRELDTEAILRSKVVCDLLSACMAEAGDLLIPMSEGAFDQGMVHGDLGEIVTRRKTARQNSQEITLFKSVGLSVQDIATAHYVYRKAVEQGVGTIFDFLGNQPIHT
jgi:alanine dehydrogenase